MTATNPPKAAPRPPRYKRVWIKIRHTTPVRYKRGWQKLPTPTVETWRDRIVKAMDWAVNHTKGYHYDEIRPVDIAAIQRAMQHPNQPVDIITDCSGSDVMLNYAAGAADPTGNDYNPHGVMFTGTIRSTQPEIRLADALPGDDIVFGPGNGAHTAKIRKPHGKNPTVFSHGDENGPWYTTFAIENEYHGGYYTVHRCTPRAGS